MAKPNCMQCKHFFITYEPRTPKGCRKFSIKTAAIPSTVVKSTSGDECNGFEAKESKKPKKKDLNDNRYW